MLKDIWYQDDLVVVYVRIFFMLSAIMVEHLVCSFLFQPSMNMISTITDIGVDNASKMLSRRAGLRSLLF
jgi:hypothetical protein